MAKYGSQYDATQAGINLANEFKSSTIHTDSDKIGAWYIAQNPKHYEVQRSNNFEFFVEGLDETFLQSIKDINSHAQKNGKDVVRLSVASSSVPHFSQEAIKVNRGNSTINFAGKPTFGTGTLKCIDYIGAGTKDVLMAWQNASYDVETEKVGLASDYKMKAYLLEYTPEYQLVRTWVLEGCWISELTEDEYNYDSADKHSINVTITYDRAYIDKSDLGE